MCFFVPRSSRHIEKDQGPDEGSVDNGGGESSTPQVCVCVCVRVCVTVVYWM